MGLKWLVYSRGSIRRRGILARQAMNRLLVWGMDGALHKFQYKTKKNNNQRLARTRHASQRESSSLDTVLGRCWVHGEILVGNWGYSPELKSRATWYSFHRSKQLSPFLSFSEFKQVRRNRAGGFSTYKQRPTRHWQSSHPAAHVRLEP